MLYLVTLDHCCIIYPSKGHLRSLYDVIRPLYIFANNFWVIPCEITQKSAILTPTPFDFGENW